MGWDAQSLATKHGELKARVAQGSTHNSLQYRHAN
jgi:hypothetical protein